MLSRLADKLSGGFVRRKITQIEHKPTHITVIMDGNGRWANGKGLTRVAGHKQGADALIGLVKGCIQQQISYLSVFAFSSENWNRPESEISALMALLGQSLQAQTNKLNENGVQLKFLGDLSRFSEQIQQQIIQAEALTQENQRLKLSIAINYGGRWDICQATRRIAEKVVQGKLVAEQINESCLAKHLITADLPDPDLLIRTSGEYRISNFMLWQMAYTELYFTHTLWPDFNEHTLQQALLAYAARERRFGKVIDHCDGQANA